MMMLAMLLMNALNTTTNEYQKEFYNKLKTRKQGLTTDEAQDKRIKNLTQQYNAPNIEPTSNNDTSISSSNSGANKEYEIPNAGVLNDKDKDEENNYTTSNTGVGPEGESSDKADTP